METKLYTVGTIANTHGIRGDVKVLVTTDFPEERFAEGNKLLAFHPDDPGKRLELTIVSAREQKGMYFLHFKGYESINEVEPYKGWLLKVTEDQLGTLEEDEFYHHEIVGCQVVTDEGEDLGVIKEILSPGANDVWVVKRPKGKDVLLPYIDDVVLDVNVKEKRVLVHLMEGLI